MKKMILTVLCAILISTIAVSAMAEPYYLNSGILSLLNMTVEEYMDYTTAYATIASLLGERGYLTYNNDEFYDGYDFVVTITYYETMNDMIMGMGSGVINRLATCQTTGQYIASQNDKLELLYEYDVNRERTPFIDHLFFLAGYDYSFLLRDDSVGLRDELNAALADMKMDGTLDQLKKEHITDVIATGEIQAIELPEISGAETITVAVTGALPPMDYVAPDGTPAGFTIAVLSEISQRINRNINLVVVDSIGRSTALASGQADVVFWAISPSTRDTSSEEYQANLEAAKSQMTEEEAAIIDELEKIANTDIANRMDTPEGTILTDSYFTDYLINLYAKP
ncbi:MAG: transporter substrate-binding domain-containing protein [Clostridia bacterium]|nr:transporter substrate-binding domain-containing protein [Clostridia bacterium]